MLDIKFIRDNPDAAKRGVAAKRADADIDALLALDTKRRAAATRADEIKMERNNLSAEVGKAMKSGADAEPVKQRVRDLGDQIKALDEELSGLDAELRDRLLRTPNLPHESVPEGASDADNGVIREWGSKPEFSFEPKAHWDIATALGLINFEQGAKITGSGFVVYEGAGARLQRTLINFMLDLHTTRHGYREVYPPFLVNRESMTGTGQYPKFVETDGAYKIEGDEAYLVPTAEVPVTNLRRDEILGPDDLPINYVAYTPCFRREAGAAGRDTRGITRVHQFDKVELVKLVKPEDSYAELEKLLADAEAVLQALGLHYRVVEICTADLGFSNAKQYDLEVWAPGMGRYLEVSSCSNFTDYQARRTNIRFRRDAKAKPEFVHTLNGSGLALPRTMIAILESGQQADGSVAVPEAIRQTFGRETL